MKYTYTSFRFSKELFDTIGKYNSLWCEVDAVIQGITEEDLIKKHEEIIAHSPETKSLSKAINQLIYERLVDLKWESESEIFADPDYSDTKGTWRLDFTKECVAIEVGFNHGGNVSWNLIKPVLSSELNHVEKKIQTEIGILISATDELKTAGGFDGAVGSYEKYVEYLKPLRNMLTTPILVVGLKAPETFRIVHQKLSNGRKQGIIELL